jgi:hypothetical protein
MIRKIKSRRMRWAGHMARMGEEKKMYKVLVGKPEGKRPLGRPKHRWKDGIRMDLLETGCGECRLDPLGSGSVAGSCAYRDKPLGSGALGVSYTSEVKCIFRFIFLFFILR